MKIQPFAYDLQTKPKTIDTMKQMEKLFICFFLKSGSEATCQKLMCNKCVALAICITWIKQDPKNLPIIVASWL